MSNIYCLVNLIRITCPCNEYPLKPHFYKVKLGYAGVYIFLIFGPKHWRGGSNVYPRSVLSKNIKNIKFFFSEILNFFNQKKSLFIAWASFRNVLYSIADKAIITNRQTFFYPLLISVRNSLCKNKLPLSINFL